MQDNMQRIVSWLQNSPMLRLGLLVFLSLLLLIPILMIDNLVSERKSRRQDAVSEVTSKWGQTQSIAGPALVLPYTHRWEEVTAAGQRVTRSETCHAFFLPKTLRAASKVDCELRRRGIFSIPVYRLDLTLEGEFDRPNLAELGIDPATVAWDRAHLAVGVSDPKAIQQEIAVTWNGNAAPFLPGVGAFSQCGTGIHAPVSVQPGADHFTFSFPLSLHGSLGLYFAPFGRSTLVEMKSNYAAPSFQGNWLPSQRSVAADGFTASWSIPFLGRNFPQAWTSDASVRPAVEDSKFGVDFINPVDHYRMADRSVKYAFLFVLLTFAVVWLVEVLSKIRLHPIQYLLLGAALCLFYLLELSLSEHLGFPLAYGIASAAVVAMVAAYSASALRKAGRALVVTGGVALLYAYLYVLLTNEDYALLVGSIGLFVMLAVIMFATRRVDWHQTGAPPA